MTRRLAGFVLLWVLSGALWPVAAAPPELGAFVRVDAAECGQNVARRASGFVWRNPSTVVTALHVVVGCRTIGIRYPVGGGQAARARVAKVLRAYDLALLTIDGPVAVTPLDAAPTLPGAGADLTVWGYPTDVRGLIDTIVRRRQTSGPLKDLLNDNVRAQIAAVGMPSLDADVVLLDLGHLRPGHSGAPILDANNQVVAVVDGGLEQGVTETNWGVPVVRLAQLVASTETIPAAGATANALFAAEIVDPSQLSRAPEVTNRAAPAAQQLAVGFEPHTCGTATLVKMRTRSFFEIAQSTDSQIGLMQIVNSVGQNLQPTDRFDIYQDLRTGATAVVPSGARLREAFGMCVADVMGETLQQLIQVVSTTPDQVQQASLQYEGRIGSLLGPGIWQIDPNWTYMAPFQRFDGLIVTRKSSYQWQQTAFGPVSTASAFETLASRGGALLGVTSVRHDLSPQKMQFQQACVAGMQHPACPDMLRELRLLAQMTIATHLSTFPIG